MAILLELCALEEILVDLSVSAEVIGASESLAAGAISETAASATATGGIVETTFSENLAGVAELFGGNAEVAVAAESQTVAALTETELSGISGIDLVVPEAESEIAEAETSFINVSSVDQLGEQSLVENLAEENIEEGLLEQDIEQTSQKVPFSNDDPSLGQRYNPSFGERTSTPQQAPRSRNILNVRNRVFNRDFFIDHSASSRSLRSIAGVQRNRFVVEDLPSEIEFDSFVNENFSLNEFTRSDSMSSSASSYASSSIERNTAFIDTLPIEEDSPESFIERVGRETAAGIRRRVARPFGTGNDTGQYVPIFKPRQPGTLMSRERYAILRQRHIANLRRAAISVGANEPRLDLFTRICLSIFAGVFTSIPIALIVKNQSNYNTILKKYIPDAEEILKEAKISTASTHQDIYRISIYLDMLLKKAIIKSRTGLYHNNIKHLINEIKFHDPTTQLLNLPDPVSRLIINASEKRMPRPTDIEPAF